MNKLLDSGADRERPETWIKYKTGLCKDCRAGCCTMPAEVRVSDFVRMGVVDPFEADEPAKNIAKRLTKAGIIDHFNAKTGLFTLARLSNDDCIYLASRTRLCTIYDKRPDTCRNHPQIGPRPLYCPYVQRRE